MRNAEMSSAKKGNNYYFRVECHAGADAESGFAHTIEATAANEADINLAHKLLNGEEDFMYGDVAYTGSERREDGAITSNHETQKQCQKAPRLPKNRKIGGVNNFL